MALALGERSTSVPPREIIKLCEPHASESTPSASNACVRTQLIGTHIYYEACAH
jgi:hypothetical protein